MTKTLGFALALLFGVVVVALLVPISPFYLRRVLALTAHTSTVEEQLVQQRQDQDNDYEKYICNQTTPMEIGQRFWYHGHAYVLTKCVLRHGYAMVNDNRLWFFEHGDTVGEKNNNIELSLLPSHVGEYAGVEYEMYGAQLDLYQQTTKVVKP